MKALNNISSIFKGDKVIWAIFILLSVCSLLIVYSSTGTLAYRVRGGNTEFFLIRQAVLLVIGFGVVLFLSYFNYRKLAILGRILLGLSVFLLTVTLFYGVSINSAARWIELPFIGLTFQTSDLAKVALVIYVSGEIANNQEKIKNLNVFIRMIVPIGLICGLIGYADLSTAILLFLVCFVLMLAGRVKMKYLLSLILIGFVGLGVLVLIGMFLAEESRVYTWMSRISDFIHNGDGPYQVQQAKIAISNGGFFGLGPGNSIQRNFLPHPYSDFVYAFIIEEWGLIGGVSVMLLYLTLFWRALALITKSPLAFGSMLILGMSLLLVLQALINMAVSVDLVPVTGLPLPIISHGGTSLIFSCISIGVILSVSRFVKLEKEPVLETIDSE